MRILAAASLVATLVTAGLVPAAQGAEQRGCVTRLEFARVKIGMRSDRVHEIFGTSGSDTGLGSPNTVRHYAVCRVPGMVQVTFSPRDRMISKSGNWFS